MLSIEIRLDPIQALVALENYKLGTELPDGSLTFGVSDQTTGEIGVAGLGGADLFSLDASGSYLGGPGSDTFNLGTALVGQYTVLGSDLSKVQPFQHVPRVDDFDAINVGSAAVVSIDLSTGRISGSSASGAFTVSFAGIERIFGASSPSGHIVSGPGPVQAFQYFPSGSDLITGSLTPDHPWLPGFSLLYGRGEFNTSGINVVYDDQGIGRVTSPAFPTAVGDRLERVVNVSGTAVADTFDMRNFGINSIGTKLNIVGVSAGDTVYGNGQTRMVLPGYALGANLGSYVTTPDFTRRVVIDLTEGSFEAYTSTVTSNNFNAWGGAVKFSGVQGLYGSSQDETMLGDDLDNFFRTEDGNDYVDGRGGLDILDYWRQAEAVAVDMAAGTVIGGPSNGVDEFRRIEQVTGTVFSDRYDATGFGTAKAVNVGDRGAYNAFQPLGGNDVVIGNGQTHVLYDLAMLPVEVNLASGYARARVASDRDITDDRNIGTDALGGVNRVTGSVFADSLTGDTGDNLIEGGAGNDTIIGGAGRDTALYSGRRTDYTVTLVSGDQYTVADTRAAQTQDLAKGTWGLSNGTDQLSGIEVLHFADGQLSLASQQFTATPIVDATTNEALHTATSGLAGYTLGTELSDGSLTFTEADKAGGQIGIAGMGGADTFSLGASGSYLGGPGSDTFNLGAALVGRYTVVGSDPSKLQPFQHVPQVDDFDAINVGSAAVASIDLSTGQMTGSSASGAFTVSFAGVERISGASSPAGHVVTGLPSVQSFQYSPSGSDRITGSLTPDQPWLPGYNVAYGRGNFNASGISVAYDANGIGKVTSPAFPNASGDILERVASVSGTVVADVFDMRNFGVNSIGTKLNIVGVSAGDAVYGNGQTRMVLPGYALGASVASSGTFVTTPDFTRRVMIDLAEGSFEAYTSNVANNNFNAWGGAVKFSGVQGLYGSAQDETMLGDDRDNFFRTEDGNDYVDGRGGLDVLDYWRQAEPVAVDMAAGTVVGGPSNGVDEFRRIEQVTGTVFSDRYDATGFGTAKAVNVGDRGTYNAFQPLGGNDVVIGNGQTHVLYDLAMLPVEVNLAEGYARARVASDRDITDDRNIGTDALGGVNRVTGSVFSDSVTGDAGDNLIEGQAGNDTIIGGAGRDIAIYSGRRADYTVTLVSGDQYTVTDTRSAAIQDAATGTWGLSDGTDQLIGIEVLRFSDKDLAIETPDPVPSGSLGGVSYHWKSHMLLGQVEVKAAPAAAVAPSPDSWFDLRATSFDFSSRTAVIEVWVNPTSTVESLGFVAVGPQGSALSFSSSLGTSWMLMSNAAQAGRLSLSALLSDMTASGLTSPTLMGTLNVKVSSETQDFQVSFSNILNSESAVPAQSVAMAAAQSSDAEGRYVLQTLPDGSYGLSAGRHVGDMGQAVTAADALAALRIALGINPNPDPDGAGVRTAPAVSPYQVMAADVDMNGRVNSADVLAILKMSVGLSSAPLPEWLFVEETRDFWDQTNNRFNIDSNNAAWNRTIEAQQPGKTNLVGTLKGDVTGNWQAPGGSVDLDLVSPSYFQQLSALIGSPLDQWHA